MPLFKLYHPKNIYGKFVMSAFVTSLVAITAIVFSKTWGSFFLKIFKKATDGLPDSNEENIPKNLIFVTSILSSFVTTFILTLSIYIFLYFLIGYSI